MTLINRATDEARIALEQISNTIRELVEKWEDRTGLELTDITLERTDVSTSTEKRSIVRVKCRAEVSARSV